MPLLMQLLTGISIRRYLPANGTAGLARIFVSGYNRVPAPPPRMIARTRFINPWQRGHFGPRAPIDQGVDAISAELICVAAISFCVIAGQIEQSLRCCHRIKTLLAWLRGPQGRCGAVKDLSLIHI